MQRTTLIGRVGNDAELKPVKDSEVVNFSVAVNEHYKTKAGEKKTTVTWYECAYWNASKVAPFLKKGTIVLVEGKAVANAYKKDDTIVANIRINVEHLELISGTGKQDDVPGANDLPSVD